MSITRPTGEQLAFNSSKTGVHVLDDYLERCERGTATLYELMEIMFSTNGNINPNLFNFRVYPGSVDANGVQTSGVIQYRSGNFIDPDAGWVNSNQFMFRPRGAYTNGTAYDRLDLAEYNNALYACTMPHTGGAMLDGTRWTKLIDAQLITAQIAQFNTESKPRLDYIEEYLLLGIEPVGT